MKIALKVTVEMSPEDVEDYCRIYGIGRSEIRRNIKDYIRTALQDSSAFTDCGEVSVA